MVSGLPDYQRGIDIAAQSLDKLSIDLIIETLGTMNVDIIAQTLSNLNIDVAAQSIGQITNRPKYGGAIRTWGGGVVDANATTTILTINGKGMIYGGSLWLVWNSTQRDSVPHVLIDGSVLFTLSFFFYNLYNYTKPGSYAAVLTNYNEANFTYSVGFAYGITFEHSVVIQYKERHGTQPGVSAELQYALI